MAMYKRTIDLDGRRIVISVLCTKHKSDFWASDYLVIGKEVFTMFAFKMSLVGIS